MNILDKLKEKGITENIIYFGKDDWSTGISVSNFLKEKELILNHYNKNNEIETIEEYIDYLFALYVLKFKEIIDLVKPKYKDEFQLFIESFTAITSNYKIKDCILFINKEYKNIYNFNKEDGISTLHLDIKQQTTDIVANYLNSFSKEIINYIMTARFINVIDNFEIWIKYFKKNHDVLEILFSKENIYEYFDVRDTDIYNSLNIMKSCDEVSKIVDILREYILEKYCEYEGEQVWISYHRISYFYEFLLKINSKYIKEFSKYVSNQKKDLEHEITEKGQHIDFKIDLKPFLDFFKDDTKPWEVKIIYTTHILENKKMKSFFEYAVSHKEKSLSDFISSRNIENNDYFDNSCLRNLDIYMFERKARLMILLSNSELTQELYSDVFGEINYIYEKINLNEKQSKVDVLYNMLFEYLSKIFLDKEDNTKIYLYGCCSLICGLIEKLLRDIFLNVCENSTIASNLTLGGMLNNLESNTLLNVYSKDELRCIRYYLGKDDKYDLIGFNIRNDMAHINEEIIDKLDNDLVLTLLCILVSTINSTILHYQNKKIESN